MTPSSPTNHDIDLSMLCDLLLDHGMNKEADQLREEITNPILSIWNWERRIGVGVGGVGGGGVGGVGGVGVGGVGVGGVGGVGVGGVGGGGIGGVGGVGGGGIGGGVGVGGY